MGFLSKYLPGNRPRAVALRESRTVSPRGNSIREGPKHKFSFKWLFTSYEGLVWFQTYLWMLKDWSWSQLQWFYPGMIFGSLAVIMGMFLVIGAMYFRAYSEASIAFGALLWVISNYWWMIGELWGYKITADTKLSFFIPEVFAAEEYGFADIFYDAHQLDTQKISSLATGWLAMTIFLLPWFYMDRDSKFLSTVNNHAPRYPFQFYFRDFLEFENVHLVFWSLKDTFWAFDDGVGYLIGFALTFSMMCTTIYFMATSEGEWINLFHYVALLWWVTANGVWAFGELFIENPNEDDIPGRGYDNYRFLPIDKEFINFFWARNATGWCFFMAVLTLVAGYVWWIFFAKFDDVEKKEALVADEADDEKKDVEATPVAAVAEVAEKKAESVTGESGEKSSTSDEKEMPPAAVKVEGEDAVPLV